MIYDVVIAGGGAAGLTSAIYAQRAGLTALVLERLFVGGQAATTYEIENYPGFPEISGPELMQSFERHARKFNAEIISADISELILDSEVKQLKTSAGIFEAKAVIVATGAKPRLLDIPGEAAFTGRGVSYCATCDGAFYRKKTVAVIGGGNTAVEDAIFLARICEKVYLVHRRDMFRADLSLTKKLAEIKNIELVLDTVPESVTGNDFVTGLNVYNKKTAERKELSLDGVFVAVGITPNNDLFIDKLKLDGQGYIITDATMATSVKGVFAAGDIRATVLRQIVTAAADGAIAAYSAVAYVSML